MEGVCATEIVVVGLSAKGWTVFAISCLSSDEYVDYADRRATGTSWKTMAIYKMCLPSERVVRALLGVAGVLIEYCVVKFHVTSTLAQSRNLQLPKLISGEIRLLHTERLAGKNK